MTRLVVLALVFLDFAAFSVYAVDRFGYLGLFEQVFANVATLQIGVDLVIALGLVSLWMWSDAAERGLPFWPYAAVTLAVGSLGPLAYLIHRELRSLRAAAGRRALA
jgi:Terpene cyclase DEP1